MVPRGLRPASPPALQAMHGKPAEPWTVDGLATLSSMSRPTFARIFRQALGQAPMKYLADWRMALARDLLLDQDRTLAEIASQVGYSSEYALATAFRRHHGQPPGRWRRQAALTTTAGIPGH